MLRVLSSGYAGLPRGLLSRPAPAERRDRQVPPRTGTGRFGGSRLNGDAATGAGFFAALGFFGSRLLRFWLLAISVLQLGVPGASGLRRTQTVRGASSADAATGAPDGAGSSMSSDHT